MKNKLITKTVVFILLTCFNLQSQTVFNVSGNTSTLNTHRNGWKMDSILVLPVRGHSISNTATPLLGRIQVNSTTQLPEYNNGTDWNYFVTENSGFTYSKVQSDARFKPITYTPTKADVGLSNADNTSDLSKPISTATQTALNSKLSAEIDGSTTNEIQSLSIVGSTLSLSLANSVVLPSNSYTAGTGIAIASNVISNTLPDQTVTIAGTTGTYPNFTLPQPVISIATRALNTNFTPSVTRTTLVSYSITCQVTNPLLVGTSTANAFLEYSTNGGTTWTVASQVGNSSGVGLTVTVQLTNGQTGTLVGGIPPNALTRIRTATTGTGSVTFVTGTEINL